MTGADELVEMLSYRRPAGSKTERDFIREWIAPLGATCDAFGNYIMQVGESDVAWLSHTDTVHPTGGRQRVEVSGVLAKLPDPPKGRPKVYRDCLGADDTTGVWLMVEMIRAAVPGLYVFHYGEERGCIGSSALAKHTPTVLEDVRYAISLDRRGFDSVITHQLGRRTASDAFAWSLASVLDVPDMGPDPTGVFTDSESYAEIVAECTNLSVGYWSQHTPQEKQDLAFAIDMRDALCCFDESRLVCERDPHTAIGEWDEDEPNEDWPDDLKEWWERDINDPWIKETL